MSMADPTTVPVREPYRDSRRLTGCNLYFAAPGAALESVPELAPDDAAVARWRDNVTALRDALGWPQADIHSHRHVSGVSVAFVAPADQLYTAVAGNEWAWCDALGVATVSDEADLNGVTERGHALHVLQALAAAEAKPAMQALQQAADAHRVPLLADDDAVSIGAGTHGQTWAIDALPAPGQVPWDRLHAVPTVLVTGSNGKTTTVRLIAALLRAHGLATAHSCTEGVYFQGQQVEGGDYSGPGGARNALRQPGAQAAVLETARGGILRRGLALCHADVAVVTNISADHFGEYGVHDLADLAAAKLVVARALGADGLLVLNADDEQLRQQAERIAVPVGWFSEHHHNPLLVAHRATGGATCGAQHGELLLCSAGETASLGSVAGMPLSLGGRAGYNIANLAAAALAAQAVGVAASTIAGVFATFGRDHADNPGRLQQWQFGQLRVVLDYAHNPDGLHGMLQAVGADQRAGGFSIVLGHAGNREDDALRAVATTVAAFKPTRVVLKDIGGYERGRQAGEIAAIMQAALLQAGVAEAAVSTELDEAQAGRTLLGGAADGDLVVLPIHEIGARHALEALLAAMQTSGWQPGDPLPVA